MCVIQGETDHIRNTQIFVTKTMYGQHQLTVYSNEIKIKEGPQTVQPAMILPVPNGQAAFEIVDLSKDADIFAKLKQCFPLPRSLTNGPLTLNSTLMVKECGSYQYSLVPTIGDFDRIDKSVFRLNPDVARLLSLQYRTGFSFLVCKIAESKKFHPLAYVHPLQDGGNLFVPTYHFHQGHSQQQADQADWDHEVYVITDKLIGQTASRIQSLKHIQSPQFTRYLPTFQPDDLQKLDITGHHHNTDMLIPVH